MNKGGFLPKPGIFFVCLAMIFGFTAQNLIGQIGDGPGISSAQILDLEIGSRAAGLGGAFAALADDATAINWNVAGLGGILMPEFRLGYSTWYQDIRCNFMAAATPLSEKFVAGLGVVYVDYGEFMAYSEDDAPLGEFSGHNLLLAFGLSFRFSDQFSAGITSKLISEKLEESSAGTYAFDFGARYQIGSFILGAMIRNIGPGLKYESERAPLPTRLTLGGGLITLHDRLRLAVDLNLPRDGFASLQQGIEYLYLNAVYLRAGYAHCLRAEGNGFKDGLTYGLGLRLSIGSLNYAYQPAGERESLHRIDLGIQFGH